MERMPFVGDRNQQRPSGLYRTIADIAGKLAVAAVTLFPAGHMAVAQNQDVAAVKRVIDGMKQEDFPKLLKLLDDNEFEVREAAQGKFRELVTDHILKYGTPPDCYKHLDLTGASLEVKRLIRDMRPDIESADIRNLLCGTLCEMPKGELSVKDILEILSHRTGTQVAYFGEVRHETEKVKKMKPGELWQILHDIPVSGGLRLGAYASGPEHLSMRMEKREDVLRTHTGSFSASLHLQTKEMHVYTEPGVHLKSWAVRGLRLLKSDGNYRDVIPQADQTVPSEFLDPRSGLTLEVTLSCTIERVGRYVVRADQSAEIATPQHTFKYLGLAKTPNRRGGYEISVRYPDDVHPGGMSCRGLDEQGEPIFAIPSRTPFTAVESWEFGENIRPQRVRLSFPSPPYGAPPETTVTLRFQHPSR